MSSGAIYCKASYGATNRFKGVHYQDRPSSSNISEGSQSVLQEISDAISASEYILSLPKNFDGEDGVEYERETLNRATSILWRIASAAKEKFDKRISAPHIDPGPNGAIDLHWKRDTWELLISMKSGNPIYSFYGDDYKSNSIKDTADLATEITDLAQWIAERE